jgi:hypothetical protein
MQRFQTTAIRSALHRSPARHARPFSTWAYETGRPLSLEALREAAGRLPVNRCKRADARLLCVCVRFWHGAPPI